MRLTKSTYSLSLVDGLDRWAPSKVGCESGDRVNRRPIWQDDEEEEFIYIYMRDIYERYISVLHRMRFGGE